MGTRCRHLTNCWAPSTRDALGVGGVSLLRKKNAAHDIPLDNPNGVAIIEAIPPVASVAG